MPSAPKLEISETLDGLAPIDNTELEGDFIDQDCPRSHRLGSEGSPECAESHRPYEFRESQKPLGLHEPQAPEERTEILEDGDFAILKVVEEEESQQDITAALTALSSCNHIPMLSMVVCEDSLVSTLPRDVIIDPIEGRDSEFDVELSSGSSVHSFSLSATLNKDDELLTLSSCMHSNPDPSNAHAEDDPLISTEVLTPSNATIYGKVVKSIQRSIRKIFHCGREGFGPHLPTSQEKSANSQSETCLGGVQNDVPMSLIRHSASPITSVSSDAVPTPPTMAPIHKTLLIDVSYSKPLLSLPRECDFGKKCLVLDLDETLVHSTFQPVPNADLVVPVHLGENIFQPIYVCKRPGVDEFLRQVSSVFEVVLFTASLSSYADPVVDFLDPTGAIRFRLYREDCLQFQGMYIKDLSRLGRDVDQVLIIDNSPASYSLHPQNALGCRSWFKDPADRELEERILPMLHRLKDASSVSEWRRENLQAIETPYI